MWSTVSGTQFAAWAKFFEFLVDDFYVRQALGSPECAHTHFSKCPEGPASGPDTLLEGQPSCLFCRFSGYSPTGV
ncbi:hypothetical protein AYI70_g7403 [Smittium culicis]|uniref:Uncharacterized protein n=1 Tax=Smittium culicis TaxID=133412 RepID=A0A1R1XKU1_9FUNG|nr:hypothetical protein AYI70_g7403 [Smittium culicis]